MSEFDYSNLKPTSIPVKSLFGKDYELREATGGVTVELDNYRDSCRVFEEGKFIGLKNTAELVPLNVSLCLFEKGSDEHVSLEFVKKLPHRVQRDLYKKAQEISDMEDKPLEIELLLKALAGTSTLTSVNHLVNKLDEKEYGPLKRAFKPTAEELAKNGQGASTDGSS